MAKLNNTQVFCRIVELGTFTAVAREMNLSAMMIRYTELQIVIPAHI